MIVIVPKGSHSPVLGTVKGVNVFVSQRGSSVAEALSYAIERHTDEKDGFIFVGQNARMNTARVWPLFRQTDFDVAAFVDRIGSTPKSPRVFDGIGRVSLDCVVFRRTTPGLRVLSRWLERNSVAPERESINLSIALAEIRDSRFLFLTRSWVWRESAMRQLEPLAEPVIEFETKNGHAKIEPLKEEKPAPPPAVDHKPRGPELLWNGHLYSYASYGKINREILLRIANSMAVKIDSASKEQVLVDEYTRARLDPYKETLIGPKAPFLRFFGPDYRPPVGRYRINWTLMETSGKVHQDMAQKVNESYDELWACTQWNADTFKAGGVRVPIFVMPLGVDRNIYRQQRRGKLPSTCRLISTSKRGEIGSPSGFTFLSVGLPSARKGFEVVADAMALAFGPKADVDLVIATTHGPTSWTSTLQAHVSKNKNRIWILEGRFNEHEMARIYAASDAYVSASIGEGWNLPAHEAAACWKPVIVPNNSVHPEIFGDDAFLFEPDGVGRIPEVEQVSPWYVGMEFSLLKTKAREALAETMKVVRTGGAEVRRKVALLDDRLASFTWDAAATNAARRLLEVQP